MKTSNGILAIVGVAMGLACATVHGQEEAPAPDAATGEVAPAEGAPADAPAAPVKPRPAEIMPLASMGLLLDIVNSGEHIIAVGDHGTIVASNDGSKWAQANVPVQAPLTAVFFLDAKTGWAVGHDAAIVHTTDGGQTWTLQNFQPELEKPFLDVLFLDRQHGFAIGAYGMFKETFDGGQSWIDLKNNIQEAELHLNSLVRLNNGDLFIAGEQGTLGVSSDQGKTWTKLQSPYESSMFGALPVGDKGAVMYGLRGNIFVTQDVRANKWTRVETGNVSSMFGGAQLPDGRLVMVGLNGVIWTMDANGGHVQRVPAPVGTTQSAVVPFKGGLLMVGESGVQVVSKLQ
jgi:photosystem II stability/assembly factor-like uncharacterized protein